jgi:hypothetical protein
MALGDRVRNVCVSPNTEWPVIEQETTSPAELVTTYLAPLAALGAVAGFIGATLLAAFLPFGGPTAIGVLGSLVAACASFVMTIVGCFVIAFVINGLAPTFGGRPDTNQALKVAVYSYTPGLVAGILRIIPILSILTSLIAGFYGLYLLYLGLPRLMKAPQEKALAYTVVIVVSAIALSFVVSVVLGLFAGIGMAGARMF